MHDRIARGLKTVAEIVVKIDVAEHRLDPREARAHAAADGNYFVDLVAVKQDGVAGKLRVGVKTVSAVGRRTDGCELDVVITRDESFNIGAVDRRADVLHRAVFNQKIARLLPRRRETRQVEGLPGRGECQVAEDVAVVQRAVHIDAVILRVAETRPRERRVQKAVILRRVRDPHALLGVAARDGKVDAVENEVVAAAHFEHGVDRGRTRIIQTGRARGVAEGNGAGGAGAVHLIQDDGFVVVAAVDVEDHRRRNAARVQRHDRFGDRRIVRRAAADVV